jgi:hypothetical protein
VLGGTRGGDGVDAVPSTAAMKPLTGVFFENLNRQAMIAQIRLRPSRKNAS